MQKVNIFFLRHGMTTGNIEKRYIGISDESLCDDGKEDIRARYDDGDYDEISKAAADTSCEIWRSPMLRCAQTAEIIFPKQRTNVENDLKECNFGKFENKSWPDLTGDEEYQAWIDSGGRLPFPGGESQDEFRTRCCKAFRKIIAIGEKSGTETVIFIVHGGTIMSIMAEYGKPYKDYFDWHVDNACGIKCLWNGEFLEFIDEF